jgi:uncharacterized protein YciI
MLYVVYCQDNPETPNKRDQHYDAHRAYLKEATTKIVMAGPFLDEDGQTRIGSMLLVEAESIQEVREFQQNDPFAVNAVWKDVFINPYVMAIDRR